MSESEREAALIERLAAELRRPVELDPAGKTRVMTAVREGAHARRRRATALGWLTRRREVMISPLGGLALAAGFAMIVALVGRRPAGEGAPVALGSTSVSAEAALRTDAAQPAADVQFVFVAPAASRVSLVGSFNDWNDRATPLHPTSTAGVWSVTVPLSRGRHVYAFVVDGSDWIADPTAPRAPDDDFGSPNSVILIGESST